MTSEEPKCPKPGQVDGGLVPIYGSANVIVLSVRVAVKLWFNFSVFLLFLYLTLKNKAKDAPH